jgi:ankyrin
MVDARGGAMRGCRHSGLRIIIPEKRAGGPTRVTCRYMRKQVHPPLNEGEALAARVLELGPQNHKFLGPIIIEIPHFASLRDKEREILVLRSDNGEKWYEHPIQTTNMALEEAFEASILNSSDDGLLIDDDKTRLTRIITTDFPKYFALITRVRQESHYINENGGLISSTVIPKVQAVFPEKALQKRIKLSLQAMPIPYELVLKQCGNRVAVSPIVTIEPRRRKFHKAITLTIPLPKIPNKTNTDPFNLRLLCSITGGLAPAQWEDITGHTPLSYVDECISFTTTVSARFWLVDLSSSQLVNECTRMAMELYREAIAVPFIGRYLIYAKRNDLNEAKLRVYCLTDDACITDKTLEKRENFHLIAKSKDLEILDQRKQYLDINSSNLVVRSANATATSTEQLNFQFSSFSDNCLAFFVNIRDANQAEVARFVFNGDSKSLVAKCDSYRPMPICTLEIDLPGYDKVRTTFILFATNIIYVC